MGGALRPPLAQHPAAGRSREHEAHPGSYYLGKPYDRERDLEGPPRDPSMPSADQGAASSAASATQQQDTDALASANDWLTSLFLPEAAQVRPMLEDLWHIRCSLEFPG